jgi:hypothetical protein
MSPTTIADPALIPDIDAFEERVAIHIHEGGIPTDQAKDLAAAGPRFPQSGPLLGLVEGVCRKEEVGVIRLVWTKLIWSILTFTNILFGAQA